MLEVVFSRPEAMVSQVVHDLNYLLHSIKDGYQMVIIKAPVVDCRGTQA